MIGARVCVCVLVWVFILGNRNKPVDLQFFSSFHFAVFLSFHLLLHHRRRNETKHKTYICRFFALYERIHLSDDIRRSFVLPIVRRYRFHSQRTVKLLSEWEQASEQTRARLCVYACVRVHFCSLCILHSSPHSNIHILHTLYRYTQRRNKISWFDIIMHERVCCIYTERQCYRGIISNMHKIFT